VVDRRTAWKYTAGSAMFRELDYYAIDGLYSDEERMARDTVRAFVQAEVMPDIGKHFTAGTFPARLIPRFGELGLFGSSLTGYGCPGMSAGAYGLICQELERGDSGVRSFCSVQSSLVMYPIWAFGSEEQKQRYLPDMARGRIIGCFGLTEPDFGGQDRRRLPPDRHQAVDHERLDRARGAGLGQAGPGRARVPGPHDHARLHGPRHSRQVVAARVGHERAHPRGLRGG
jgi:hypothetical protein